MPVEIVSGGQTGVDRGALDVALQAGVSCGGWVPQGRKAEDGAITERYPVQELAGGYRRRTRQNVVDSGGTVLMYFGELAGGTQLTLWFCLQEHKSYLPIDASELVVDRAAQRLREFVHRHTIRRLNVAGPREGGAPGARAFSYGVIAALLSRDE